MHLALHPVPASSDGHAQPAPVSDTFDPIAAAHDLAVRGRQWIRASGLLALPVPREYGVTQYRYTVVTDRTVLVDPGTGRVVQVID